MIKKFKDVQKEIDFLRHKGFIRGENTGFKCLDEFYSLKQGTFTMILAAPHHGKSEFAFELVFNQGKKALIYSPETGSVEDIYAEFIHKFTGKSIYKSEFNHCTDIEYQRAAEWVDYNFSIIDSDEKAYSFEELTKMVTDEEIILCDPYNEMNHAMKSDRQDLYIEELLGEIRRYCKKNRKHCIMTLHPAYQKPIVEKGMTYYPMPVAREAAGGQANLRKAMTWINLWRPPTALNDENGCPYDDNVVLIQIEKAKPKGVSKRGTCQLYFDWKRNRYYEKDFYRKELYAFEHEKSTPVSIATPKHEFPTFVQSDECEF